MIPLALLLILCTVLFLALMFSWHFHEKKDYKKEYQLQSIIYADLILIWITSVL